MYDWKEKLAAGKEGAARVMALVANRPETVSIKDVQDDPPYQPKGIDFLWERRRWDGGTETVAVEVKWDSYTTRNIAFETVSVVEKGTPGCFLTSVADVWIYCFKGYSWAFMIPLARAREWFLAHQQEYRTRVTSSRDAGRGEWHTEFALVPIKELLRNVPGVIDLPMPLT